MAAFNWSATTPTSSTAASVLGRSRAAAATKAGRWAVDQMTAIHQTIFATRLPLWAASIMAAPSGSVIRAVQAVASPSASYLPVRSVFCRSRRAPVVLSSAFMLVPSPYLDQSLDLRDLARPVGGHAVVGLRVLPVPGRVPPGRDQPPAGEFDLPAALTAAIDRPPSAPGRFQRRSAPTAGPSFSTTQIRHPPSRNFAGVYGKVGSPAGACGSFLEGPSVWRIIGCPRCRMA